MNPGDYLDTWGDRRNNQVDLYDASMDGVEALTVSGSVTLTTANGSADQARKRALNCTGTGGTITIPNVEKNYLIRNATSGDIIVTTGSGTTATVKAGNVQWVFSTGSNACYIAQVNDFGAANVATTGTLAAGATTVTGTLSCTGNATLGDATTDVATVNGQLIATKTVDFTNGNASLLFNGTGNGWIDFQLATGTNSPAVVGVSGASRSNGTRVVISRASSSSVADFAIGIDNPGSSGMWFSVPDSGSLFRYYAGAALVASISGSGQGLFKGSGSATTASAANLFIDSTTGLMTRSTSAARYKTDIQPLEAEYANRWLGLTPVYYRSLCAGDDPKWGWYGFVADEAAEKGLPQLVHWGGENKDEPEGYQYERDGAFAQWHIKQLYERIAALEAKLA